ncbi:PH domain-containing protein [Ditylenchus destructor]|uniref:PH domain-containing protein n=1 Tax=Ditylenchus destructor TaxID=166010 RepID=A0AAD4R4L9_9BILA|nr:PH domain-containing protein [Ditylenchus destructor]
MFHQLAPVGLPPAVKKPSPHLSEEIERDMVIAITDISDNALKQKIAYNLSHPDTRALLRALDAFFNHGLMQNDKCYWYFVREFLPIIEQENLRRQWNCNKGRALSVAWLKDSLNRSNLHFQLLSFATCDMKVRAKWYMKSACMRNRQMLKRICSFVEQLNSVEFEIAKPYLFRTEDVPIALPTTAPMSPPVAPSIETSSPMNVNSLSAQNYDSLLATSNRFSVNSFSQIAAISYLGMSAHDLPAVNLPSSAHEPFLSTAKDRDYMLDEIIKSHKKKANGYISAGEDNPENAEQESTSNAEATDRDSGKPPSFDDLNNLAQESARESSDMCNVEEPIVDSGDLSTSIPLAQIVPAQSESSFRSSDLADRPIGDVSDTPSEVEEGLVVDGQILLDSGEIVQLAMDVFQNSERFQKMFLIYMGHSSGQPIARHLVITDQSIYLLSTNQTFDNAEEIHPSSYTETTESTPFFVHSVKYTIYVVISLAEIDFVTVGIDSQVHCLHLKRRRRQVENLVPHSRTYVIETGCKMLGKMIAYTINQAIQASRLTNENPTDNEDKKSLVLTRYTQLSIILNRFAKQELGLSHVDILHHSLIYWHQNMQQESRPKDDELMGYLYWRTVNAKSWVRRFGEWQHSYFILKGCMLYQFSDSSCKFAQKSYNIKENVQQVFEAELKDDEKYVFEITMAEENANGLQFSCTSSNEMKNWVNSISVALSHSNEMVLPVACMLILTDTNILFAQEGANCLADGFMRSLGMLWLKNIAGIYSVRTECHNAIVAKREDGNCDWIFLRDEGELKRLIDTFTQKWRVVVEDCNADETPQSNQMFMQCVKMPDMWRISIDQSPINS